MTDPRVLADGVRARNLSRVLRAVHEDGPISRAALTTSLGLNRSTIADLVAALADAGLVQEHAPPPAGRVGRPSPVVAVHPRVFSLAVNPELDAVEIALVRLDRSIPHRERIDVDHVVTPEECVRLVVDRLAAWQDGPLDGARVAAIGVAVPGLVRAADGVVRTAPHLGWNDVPLRELLTSATGIPAVIGNDATLGVVAEHRFGAARGIADVVYLNGGASGIGGGLVVGGVPVTGAGGYAGEFGQNRPGIATGADRRAPDGVLEDEVSRARLLDAVGLSGADDDTLAEALRTTEGTDVTAEVDRQRRILATALANAVNVLDPAVVVLGGFLATLADVDIAALESAVAEQAMPANAEGLDIRVASLAGDRLLIGAAEAAFETLLADPVAGASAD